MPLDPQFAALIAQLAEAGALPLVRGDAETTRRHYRSLAMARRGADYTPLPVAEVADDRVPGPGGPIPVRVYTPEQARDRVVTYLHGGGWVIGDLDTHDPVCRRVATELRATVASVDYRLAPEHPHPAPLEDTMAALAWTVTRYPDHAHVVAGDSAGASLAAGAALAARDRDDLRLDAQLLIYPATDPACRSASHTTNGQGYFLTAEDMEWFYRQYLPDEGARRDPSVALADAPDLTGLPPAVLATAEFDPLRDEGQAYARRLAEAGVPVRHIPGPGLIHGYFAFLGVVDQADRVSGSVLAAVDELLG